MPPGPLARSRGAFCADATLARYAARLMMSTTNDHLMGIREIASLLGVSPQRADALSNKDGFPTPTATLASGRIWLRVDVEKWAREKGRIK
jgi:predicted DNA-binding transcriptional regulator AlpA